MPSPIPGLTTQRRRTRLICQIYLDQARKLNLDLNLLILWLSLTMLAKRRKAATRGCGQVLQLKFNSSRLAPIDVARLLNLRLKV